MAQLAGIKFLQISFNAIANANSDDLASYSRVAVSLLRSQETDEAARLAESLNSALKIEDERALKFFWRKEARNNQEVAIACAPLVVALGYSDKAGVKQFQNPARLLAPRTPDDFSWATKGHLMEALGGIESANWNFNWEQRTRVAAALQQQIRRWQMLQKMAAENQIIAFKDGLGLTNRGDWAMFQTMLYYLSRDPGERMLVSGFVSQGGEVAALHATAGLHPRLGDVYSSAERDLFMGPIVMFPEDPIAQELIVKTHATLIFNPVGPHMHIPGPATFRHIQGNTTVYGANKTAGATSHAAGRPWDEVVEANQDALKEAGVVHELDALFKGGFSGVDRLVKRKKLVPLPEIGEGREGIHEVICPAGGKVDPATHTLTGTWRTLEEAKQHAAELTRGAIPEELDVVKEGKRSFKMLRYINANPPKGVPLVIDIIVDPIVSAVNRKAEFWKNPETFQIYWDTAHKIAKVLTTQEIEGRRYDDLDELHTELIKHMKERHHRKVKEALKEVENVLLPKVELFRKEDVVIVDGIVKDYVESSSFYEMGPLVSIIKKILTFANAVNGDGPKELPHELITDIQRAVDSISTRNGRLGFIFGCWDVLRSQGILINVKDLIPKGQYEVVTTFLYGMQHLRHVSKRRQARYDDLITALPSAIERFMQIVTQAFQPADA
jgi:hypothetical protein